MAVEAAPERPSGDPRRLVVVIAGPTAVGKSDAALLLAEGALAAAGGAELVSADSVQVYRRLDIGSNKPTAEEQRRCPTHLVDCFEPSEACTVGSWTAQAVRAIDDIHSRGRTPVVVGGSCMYLDWLVHGERDSAASDPATAAAVEEELRPLREAMDWRGALALLAEVAPERSAKLQWNDWRRLARHLEAARAPPKNSGRASRGAYDVRAFFLCPSERRALFERIDARCMAMLRRGLLEETAALLQDGVLDPDSSGGLAIGYRQAIEYLARPEPKDSDVEAFGAFLRAFASATRAYARSQAQWFAKDAEFMWLPADPTSARAVSLEIARLVALPREEFDAARGSAAGTREAWAAQGTAQGPQTSFVSRFGRGGAEALPADVADLVAAADVCTRRVPDGLRASLRQRLGGPPAPPAAAIVASDGTRYGKVFWNGRHRAWGWGAPLGKVHKQGMKLLHAFGWHCVDEKDDSLVPVFCWPTRRSMDVPLRASGAGPLPLIRPFPLEFTRRLDDKEQLASHLKAAGQESVHPPTWTAQEFLQADVAQNDEAEVWFSKQVLGVKGTGVHIFRSAAALRRHVEELGDRGRRGLIAQRGVQPPALGHDGRRWTLRAHALLLHRPAGEARPQLYCHREMVVIEHRQPYTADAAVRAAHISSAGHAKHWPEPYLLDSEDIAAQVRSSIARTFASVWEHLPRGESTPPEAQLCQVFGVDLTADAHGRVWLLEVNDYPAIASGTMSHVDVGVYTTLVRDVLRLAVLPLVDGAADGATPGGFVELDVAAHVVGRAVAAELC